jgi:hypothetical protein
MKVLNSSGAQVYYRADSSDNEADAILPLDVIADLRSNTDNAIDRVSLAGHTTEGDGGGGEFWLDTSDTTTADDNGINIVDSVSPRIGTWKRLYSGPVSVRWYGANGADATVDTVAIQAASNHLGDVGGGTLYFPSSTAGYLANDDIILWSKTTVIMDAFVKRTATITRAFDCMFIPQPGAENVRFERMLLDCNNTPAISGGILRRNNRYCSVGYAYVKNAATDAALGGGRGWIIEDGVTGNNPKMCAIDTLVVEDSFNGFAFNGGFGSVAGDKNDACNIVKNLILHNVECPIGVFGNNPVYPHDGQDMSCIVQTVIARNCGKISTTSSPALTGIIDSVRGSNFMVENIYLHNDDAYMAGAASMRLWDGEYKNCHILNAVIDSDLEYIIRDGATAIAVVVSGSVTSGSAVVTATDTKDLEKGYAVVGAGIPVSTTILSIDSKTQFTMSANGTATSASVSITASGTAVCKDSTFKVQVNGTVSTDLILSSVAATDHLLNNRYDFSVDAVTTDRLVPANINTQTSNYLSVQSKAENCLVKGRTGAGGIAAGFLISSFNGATAMIGSIGMSDTNGQAHALTVNTVDQLLVDGVFANKMQDYTVATLPSAATYIRTMIYVSDASGGAIPAFSDGSNWRRVTDRAVIS